MADVVRDYPVAIAAFRAGLELDVQSEELTARLKKGLVDASVALEQQETARAEAATWAANAEACMAVYDHKGAIAAYEHAQTFDVNDEKLMRTFLGGTLSDYMGAARTFSATTLNSGLMMVLVSVSPSMRVMQVWWGVSRLGGACYWPAMIKVTSSWWDEDSFGERYAELLRPIRCEPQTRIAHPTSPRRSNSFRRRLSPRSLSATLSSFAPLTQTRLRHRANTAATWPRTGISMWRRSSRTTWRTWSTSRSPSTTARPS
jgi:hypothetical protein